MSKLLVILPLLNLSSASKIRHKRSDHIHKIDEESIENEVSGLIRIKNNCDKRDTTKLNPHQYKKGSILYGIGEIYDGTPGYVQSIVLDVRKGKTSEANLANPDQYLWKLSKIAGDDDKMERFVIKLYSDPALCLTSTRFVPNLLELQKCKSPDITNVQPGMDELISDHLNKAIEMQIFELVEPYGLCMKFGKSGENFRCLALDCKKNFIYLQEERAPAFSKISKESSSKTNDTGKDNLNENNLSKSAQPKSKRNNNKKPISKSTFYRINFKEDFKKFIVEINTEFLLDDGADVGLLDKLGNMALKEMAKTNAKSKQAAEAKKQSEQTKNETKTETVEPELLMVQNDKQSLKAIKAQNRTKLPRNSEKLPKFTQSEEAEENFLPPGIAELMRSSNKNLELPGNVYQNGGAVAKFSIVLSCFSCLLMF